MARDVEIIDTARAFATVPEVAAVVELAERLRKQNIALQRQISAGGKVVGSKQTHQQKRTEVRRRLEAEGAAPELVEKVIEQMRWEHLVERHGEAEAARIRYREQPGQPNDRRHRPAHVPAELRGAARVTGETAAAVRRGTTVTDWQYEDRRRSQHTTEGDRS